MKDQRHEKILELIGQREIDTQEELLKALRENQFHVTQATVSRDIKELRLVKKLSPDGKYRYTAPDKQEEKPLREKYFSLLSDAILTIDYAGNIVAVKCNVGMAQAACAAIDSMEWETPVGTLAGDDTFFILMRTEQDAKNFAAKLHSFIGR